MEKETLGTDYAAILADMEAKKAALEAAITSMRAALAALGSMSGEAVSATAVMKSPEPVPLPRGALLGKSGPDAIRLYLESVKKKQTNREIAEALKSGGVESTGKNFDAYINSALFRLKNTGEILRFDDGWGLAEWYPESFRAKVAEKTNGGVKKKSKKRAMAPPKRPTKPIAQAQAEPGLEQKIINLFGGNTDTVLDSEVIIDGIDANQKVVNLTLGRLAAKHKLVKTDGGYKLSAIAS